MGFFNKLFRNIKVANTDESIEEGIFNKFVQTYKPADNLVKPTQQILDWYRDKLPADLLEFWRDYGFGNFGDGVIKVVEPSDYMDSFYAWTGTRDYAKLPILVTAFGDIFYYRKLSGDNEDISLLDIHYRKINVCEYSLKDFFGKYIVNKELAAGLLKKQLFEQGLSKLGLLKPDDIYYFQPALFLGGSPEPEYLSKGIGSVHQMVLLQLGQQQGL